MRPIALLVLLAAVAPAQEGKPEHDQLGFPVTFNDERITRSEVIRSLGAEPTPGAVAARREQILMNKLTERIGQIWGIEVHESDVQAEIRRQIEILGGEAKFYAYLGQRGDTLARYEEEKRLQLLRFNLDYLLRQGVTRPPQRRVLPWATMPTPDEIRIAYEHDKKRLVGQGARARGIAISVSVPGKTKQALLKEHGVARFGEELQKYAKGQADTVIAKLEQGRSFLDLAKELGVDAEAESRRWTKLPKAESSDPILRFYQTAKPGTWSQPIPQPGGVYTIAYLVLREKPGERGLEDPLLVADFRTRIHGLRRDKIEARMRLQALDGSSIEPPFVKRGFRKTLLADLRVAVQGLRALGLN